MERYKCIVTQTAKEDMRSISHYIAHELHMPGTAKNLLLQIRREIISLNTMPERYSLSHDEAIARKGYHVTSVRDYLLFYSVDKSAKTVNVERVLHGSLDLKKWL